MEKLRTYLFAPRFSFSRFQFNLIALFFISTGLVIGMYVALANIIPTIFAADTPWTQTDWSGGQSDSVATATVTTYSAVSNVDATGTSGQLSLSAVEEFSDFGIDTDDDLDNWLGVNPTSISGLQVYVKADAGVYTDDGSTIATDGQDVQQWNDQSSEEYNFTAPSAARRPTYSEDEVNGRAALTFGPDNDTANNSDAMNVSLTDISTLSTTTVFSVGSFDYTNQPASNYDYIYSIYNSASPTVLQGAIARQASNGGNPDKYYSIYGGSAYLGPVITSGFKLFTQQTSNVSPRHFLWMDRSSQSVATLASLTSIPNPRITLGKYQNSTWALNGRIAEFMLFNTVLDANDIHKVENYLNNKYNLGTTTLTVDASIKRTGAGSAKVVTVTNTAELLQNVNVGDTDDYNLVAYAYTDGSEVTSSDAQLYYNGSTVSTTFASVGGGWYKLSGTVTGAAATRSYGVQVKANKTVYIDDFSLSKYAASGTLTSNIFNTEQLSAWGALTYTSSGSTVAVKVRSSNSSSMSGADDWSVCSAVSSSSDLSSTDCVTDGEQYIQYQVALSTADETTTPTFSDISIAFSPYDETAPTTNASTIVMSTAGSGGRSIASNGWNSASQPYFSWTAGADNDGGSGLKGYCVYVGTDSAGNPATSKGVLGTSPVSLTGSTCQFIISSTNLNLATAGYLGSALTDNETYYINIKAIDNGSNVFGGSSATFHFRQDATAPTNTSYISAASGSFGNVTDMSFNWPISGGSAGTDAHSGVLGYQYQLNGTSGTWLGTDTSDECGLSYIPAADSSYAFTADQDEENVEVGNNVIYFRLVDTSCNTSSASTYRTASISYGGAAPTFATSCESTSGVTVTPSSSTSNSFALSWETATAADDQSVEKYYYMINTSPPASLATITSNTATYISNDTSTSVAVGALTGSVRGSNTVYIIAVDDADNYSSSNCIKGTYTLNSTNPDPPLNLAATDASVKSADLWRASLGWDVPSYKGTGSLTYKIQRSTDNSTWTDVTTTTGTSYIDTVATSAAYYWRVGTYDSSSQSQTDPSYATAVSLIPKGTYSEAPTLSSDPTVSGITTQNASITWSTSRTSDSKVQYGTSSGSYFTEEPSNSAQTTSHTINLTNLDPGTTYYYVAKWTDEDGNTGTSSESSFTTDPAPTVQDVSAINIGLDSAVIQFTSNGASSVKIYYGTTTAFGGSLEISTSTSTTTYTSQLTGLTDGTKYYYKINTFDTDDTEYEGTVLDFTTLPRPRISGVVVQQVANAAQPTILVSWSTNTQISSIVTYYPQSNPAQATDEVNVTLVSGAHQMIVRGLLPQTLYNLVVKGRDKAGNEATSDIQTVTTATDTRPPQITGLKVEGKIIQSTSSNQEAQAQLVVTWNTDEPSSSQVEFGEGTGTSYSQKTQEDSNLTTNHLVVISGLTPSKVYHLRALSSDKADNEASSIDTVIVTPKASAQALNLVITNLQQVFGFLGK